MMVASSYQKNSQIKYILHCSRNYNDTLQEMHNVTHLVELGKGHGMHEVETLCLIWKLSF